jgi:hypothetical protein
MDARHEDCFVVFLRRDRNQHAERRECDEEELAVSSSYAEARQVKREYEASGCDCVIRYVGPAGGGD